MARPGSVLVVASTDEVDDVRSLVAQHCQVGGITTHQLDDRVLLAAPAPSKSEAQAQVATLRALGLTAVSGPASEAERISWERHSAPKAFGRGSCVAFPWTEFDRTAFGTIVEIDPGMGFGSGGHPTTLLVLDQLDAAIAAGTRGRVLDVGSGSGVLAIAASLLGVSEAVALDISEDAVRATKANGRRNKVAHKVRVVGHDLGQLEPSFDLVLANIHAPILVALAPDMSRLLAPDGQLILSGISGAQRSMVAAALRPLEVVAERERDEWWALTFRHA